LAFAAAAAFRWRRTRWRRWWRDLCPLVAEPLIVPDAFVFVFVFWGLGVFPKVVPPRVRIAVNARVAANLFLIVSSAAPERSTVV
jgi:hypothetical protein